MKALKNSHNTTTITLNFRWKKVQNMISFSIEIEGFECIVLTKSKTN